MVGCARTNRDLSGILKNSFQRSPPASPTKEREDLTEKELVIQNTQANAGHRRSSSAASRPAGSRRQSSRTPSMSAEETQQRLKWDEANLYLTEQERTSTMKITEPKTPYAKHYEPSEDEDDDLDMELGGSGGRRGDDIPNLNLGEPEEAVPEDELDGTPRKESKVHVNDDDATPLHDADGDMIGLSAEELEKHRRFEELRKKHYEMSEAVGLLGHPEAMDEDLDDDDEEGGKKNKAIPPMPKLPPGINGTS